VMGGERDDAPRFEASGVHRQFLFLVLVWALTAENEPA
jgi:hypothetical protein